MRRIADFITAHAGLGAVVVLVSLIVPAWVLPRATIDNSISVWTRSDCHAARQYEQFIQRYGSDEFVLAAFKTPNPLSDAALAEQEKLAASLRKIPGVQDVLDLPETLAMMKRFAPAAATRPARDPLIRNLLLSADGRTAGMVAWLSPLHGPDARRQVVAAIQSAAAAAEKPNFRVHLAGTPLMNVELDLASAREARTLLPVAAAVAIVALVLMLRSFSGVVACVVGVSASVLWTVGLMVLAGRAMNMVTLTLPSLLFVLGMSPGIYIASRFQSHLPDEPSARDAMRATLRPLVLPILLAGVTTAVGFGSLMISSMAPVRDLGIFAAGGILIAVACNLLVVPGLLLGLYRRRPAAPATPADASDSPSSISHWTSVVGAAVARHPRLVAVVSVAVMAASAASFPTIRADSNVLSFFPEDARIARDYQFISQNLTGYYTLELDTQTTAADEPAVSAALGRLAQKLSARHEVARVDYFGRFKPILASLNALSKFHLATTQAVEQVSEAARRFRRQRGDTVHLRTSILVRSMSSGEFYGLLDAARADARAVLPAGKAKWDFTGAVLLLNEAQKSLVVTQVRSFAVAAAVVLAMMAALFGSARVGLAAGVPNLLPVFGAFAIMALAGIPIDPATVMIASVAIGLAVDGTTHYLACYREQRPRAASAPEASAAALNRAGKAMVLTSVVAAAGFGVLCLASFRPLAYFGLLTGATLLAALACDLLVTPAWAGLLGLWKPREKP